MQFINNMLYPWPQNYMQEFPSNLGKAMLYSFVGGFLVSILWRNDPKAGLIAGAFSVTATVIHALVTPLFRHFINSARDLTWNEEMCRTGISLIATGYIAAAFGDLSIIRHLFVWAILYGLTNYVNPERRNTNEAVDFYVIPGYPIS